MNKMIMNRLTMLAVTLMASMACFAQGKSPTTIGSGHVAGDIFDYQELRYYVLSNSGILELEVIGLASQISGSTGDETLLTSEFDNKVTIPLYVSGTVAGQSFFVSSIAANAFTSTSCRGDAADNKANFADAAALVTSITIDYNEEYDAATIGANAFAGLTALTEVNNLTPGTAIAAIPTTAFATSVFSNATLIVPDGSMAKYVTTTGWKKFVRIQNTSGDVLGNVAGSSDPVVIDVSDLRKLKSLMGKTSFPENADLNGDGKIDVSDVRKLKSMM